MKYRKYTEQEVIQKTREALTFFSQKRINQFTAMLAKDFVWIGDYTPLYMRGIPAFVESVRSEAQELPVQLSAEEYNLLAHQKNLWVVFGRFTVTAFNISTKIHFTFVWEQKENALLLKLANATHAKEMEQNDGQSKFFTGNENELIPYDDMQKKITLRDMNGTTRYLNTDEICYIKSNNKYCDIFTKDDSFPCRITLSELTVSPFIRIHKSYLVNPAYIRQLRRYSVTLSDGLELPVSRNFYMELKNKLFSLGKTEE